MFNLSGSEIVFLLIIALVVLGPEKLPDAVRRFGKFYGEFKRMSTGFQTELRNALDEPMREMRETSDALRKAANLDFEPARVDGDTGMPAVDPLDPPPAQVDAAPVDGAPAPAAGDETASAAGPTAADDAAPESSPAAAPAPMLARDPLNPLAPPSAVGTSDDPEGATPA